MNEDDLIYCEYCFRDVHIIIEGDYIYCSDCDNTIGDADE